MEVGWEDGLLLAGCYRTKSKLAETGMESRKHTEDCLPKSQHSVVSQHSVESQHSVATEGRKFLKIRS